MSEEFGAYLCNYITNRMGIYKKYLLSALENKDRCIWYLEYSEGSYMSYSDLKNCELLRDAGLFTEDIKFSRNGRNSYRFFYLTDVGKRFAEALKLGSVLDKS